MSYITLIGAGPVLTVIAFAGAAVLARKRQWPLLAGWAAAFTGGGVINAGLKLWFRRPRPPHADLYLGRFSWSFPSGHALGSLITYGMVAYVLVVLWARSPRERKAVIGAAATLVLVIGATRLYLGVHYVSDVIAGFALGAMWLAACIAGTEVARHAPRGDPG